MLFALITLSIEAQAQIPLKMEAGAIIAYSMSNWSDSYVNGGPSFTDSDFLHKLSIGGFFDAEYVRGVIDYSFLLGGSFTRNGGTTPISNGSVSYIDISVYGKYPFQIDPIYLWPALGLRYSLCASYSLNGTNELLQTSGADFNDLYVIAGAGMDWNFYDQFSLTPTVLLLLNVTPSKATPAPTTPSAHTYFGLSCEIGIAVAYKFK
jgi:hypothetical protein